MYIWATYEATTLQLFFSCKSDSTITNFNLSIHWFVCFSVMKQNPLHSLKSIIQPYHHPHNDHHQLHHQLHHHLHHHLHHYLHQHIHHFKHHLHLQPSSFDFATFKLFTGYPKKKLTLGNQHNF